VYDRRTLGSGVQLRGPCVIEEPDSTTIIGPDVSVQVDTFRNLIATFEVQAP